MDFSQSLTKEDAPDRSWPQLGSDDRSAISIRERSSFPFGGKNLSLQPGIYFILPFCIAGFSSFFISFVLDLAKMPFASPRQTAVQERSALENPKTLEKTGSPRSL